MDKDTTSITKQKTVQRIYPNTAETIRKSSKHYRQKLYLSGLSWGIIAAILMSLFLKLTTSFTHSFLSLMFIKYLFLALIIFYAIASQKKYLKEEFHFSDGMGLGGLISLFSALSIAIIKIFASLLATDIGFQRFSENGSDLQSTLLISGTLFFETLVFGIISVLICLQYLKRKPAG